VCPGGEVQLVILPHDSGGEGGCRMVTADTADGNFHCTTLEHARALSNCPAPPGNNNEEGGGCQYHHQEMAPVALSNGPFLNRDKDEHPHLTATGEQHGNAASQTKTKDGHHGILAHFGRASVHLKLVSFGCK